MLTLLRTNQAPHLLCASKTRIKVRNKSAVKYYYSGTDFKIYVQTSVLKAFCEMCRVPSKIDSI